MFETCLAVNTLLYLCCYEYFDTVISSTRTESRLEHIDRLCGEYAVFLIIKKFVQGETNVLQKLSTRGIRNSDM
jgi:hypothetical protein